MAKDNATTQRDLIDYVMHKKNLTRAEATDYVEDLKDTLKGACLENKGLSLYGFLEISPKAVPARSGVIPKGFKNEGDVWSKEAHTSLSVNLSDKFVDEFSASVAVPA